MEYIMSIHQTVYPSFDVPLCSCVWIYVHVLCIFRWLCVYFDQMKCVYTIFVCLLSKQESTLPLYGSVFHDVFVDKKNVVVYLHFTASTWSTKYCGTASTSHEAID